MDTSPFASVIGLGALQSRHALARRSRTVLVVLGVVYALGWCALLGASYVMAAQTYQETQSLLQALGLPLFCVLVWLAPGVLLVKQVWGDDLYEVAVYEKGLAVRARQGVTSFAWEAIADFWTKANRTRTGTVLSRTYVVRTEAGQTFQLHSSLENFDQLAAVVAPRANEAVAQRLWQKVQAGERLKFVALELDRDGLYFGKHTLRWSEIEGLRVQPQEIGYKQNGEWKKWFSLTFVVPPALAALARRFTRVEG